LKQFLKFKVVNLYAPNLPRVFSDAHFQFNRKVLKGQDEMEPRWKACQATVSKLLTDLVGKTYVQEYFSETSKATCSEMVHSILEEFEIRIKNLEWMSDITKQRALEKLSTMRVKIGYPSHWKDYSLLQGQFDRDAPFVTNLRKATAFYVKNMFRLLGKTVDKDEWHMGPFEVNAYYNPLGNEIVFPAAILQPPFFYGPTADLPRGHPAMNFGGIGAVIRYFIFFNSSHEITHGFDDQGSQFNSNGRMENWWQEQDLENFTCRCKKIEVQFDKYSICGQHVNGKLCCGESIRFLM
jgi:putative endopeptidase